jgi:membrane protease YdiL (CAAX protease family)
MNKINKLPLIAVVFMAIFSLANIFGIGSEKVPVSFASITLVIGISVFFITWSKEKEGGNGDGLDIKTFPKALKDKHTLILIFMPSIMNIICYITARLFVPEFVDHVAGRIDFLALDKFLLLIIQFMVAAFDEEIAWRAFFQKQLSKIISFAPVLIISSALFAVCHYTQGNIIVVLYDILFVFVNAIFYGIIFRRTDNAFVSATAHFLANLLGAIALLFL